VDHTVNSIPQQLMEPLDLDQLLLKVLLLMLSSTWHVRKIINKEKMLIMMELILRSLNLSSIISKEEEKSFIDGMVCS
jgi:hypothetical protein